MAEENHRIDLAFDAADEYRPEPPPPPEIPAWKDGSIRIGIHTSIAGDIACSLDLAARAWRECSANFFVQPAHVGGSLRAHPRRRRGAFPRAPPGIGTRAPGHSRQLSDQSCFAESRAARAIDSGLSSGNRASGGAGRGFPGGSSGLLQWEQALNLRWPRSRSPSSKPREE